MSIDFNQRTAYLREIGRAARKKSTISGNELGVLSEVVNIYSDGVRLSATIWRPDRATASDRPAILLCHGWGGIRDHLDSDYAPKFAAEGFLGSRNFCRRGHGRQKFLLRAPGQQNSCAGQ